jgi:PPOX class probable F420-dependent enzyme
MDDSEARGRFAAAPLARLATITPSGRPHLVPITFACWERTVASVVDAKPKRTRDLARLRHIARNPAVSVLVDHYEDDWQNLWWVRADGAGRVVEGGREFEGAVDLLVAKYPQYRTVRPAGPAIIITVDRWMSWAAVG